MHRMVFPIAAVWACALCVSSASAQQELKFANWKIPATAKVVQLGEIRDNTIEMQFEIKLDRAGDQEYRLSFSKLESLSFNGEPAEDLFPSLAEKKQADANLQMGMPAMRISNSGRYLGVADWDGYVDNAVKMLRNMRRNGEPPDLEKVREQFKTKKYREMLEIKMGETWQAWVGGWQGLSARSGETRVGVTPLPFGNGTVQANFTLKNLGERSRNGLVDLESLCSYSEDRPEFLEELLVEMTQHGSRPVKEGEIDVRNLTFELKVNATTDPETLQPFLVETAQTISFSSEGETVEQVKKARYQFYWQ